MFDPVVCWLQCNLLHLCAFVFVAGTVQNTGPAKSVMSSIGEGGELYVSPLAGVRVRPPLLVVSLGGGELCTCIPASVKPILLGVQRGLWT